MMRSLMTVFPDFPVYAESFVQSAVFEDEEICPFVERTGYIDLSLLSSETEITFKREKDNPADDLAVMVLANGVFIGYLYRLSRIRPYLLAGKKDGCSRYIARIASIDIDKRRIRLSIAFYVKMKVAEEERLGTWLVKRSKENDCVPVKNKLLEHFCSLRFSDARDDVTVISSLGMVGRLPRKAVAALKNYRNSDPVAKVVKIAKDKHGRNTYAVAIYGNSSPMILHAID